MLIFAHITAGAVDNLCLYEAAEDAPEGAVDVTALVPQPGRGWNFDGHAFAPPPAPAVTAEQLLAYASDKQNAVLAGVWTFNVAASGQPAHTVTTKLDDRGQFAMLKVQGWLQLNAQTAGAMMPYSNVDFSATSLTVAEADSLVEQAAALDVKSYTLLNQVQASVTASPPTITAMDQIDQVFAGLTV